MYERLLEDVELVGYCISDVDSGFLNLLFIYSFIFYLTSDGPSSAKKKLNHLRTSKCVK